MSKYFDLKKCIQTYFKRKYGPGANLDPRFFFFFFVIRVRSICPECTAVYKAYCATLFPP
jgi:hypothetical protein